MIDKEYVLVSQGIEIYRTKSQENAVNMVKEYNDEYFDYLQKCYDNYERPADNYVDLEIEYSNEKEKDKEIERLNKEKENLTNIVANKIIKDYDIETPLKDELNKSRLKNLGLESQVNRLNNIINELEKELKNMATLKTDKYGNTRKITHIDINWLLLKIKELKGEDKE